MSGCTTALILAAAGRQVTVLESAVRTSPLLRGFRRAGHLCETGFHYTGGLDEGGALRMLFDRFGMMRSLDAVALPADGFDLLVWRGREIRIPVGADRVRTILTEAFPASRRAIRAYFEALARFLRETPFLNPDVSPAFMPRTEEDDVSLEAFMAGHGAEPELVELLGLYGACLCGVGATEIPMRTNALVLGSYFRSAHWIVGGGEALALALEDALIEAGVDVVCQGRVAEITATDSKQVSGVKLDRGDRLESDTVVFTGHPGQLAGLLAPGAARPAYRHRLEALENTPSFVVVYLDCPNAPTDLQSNRYFLGACPDHGPEESSTALMAASPVPSDTKRTHVAIEAATPRDLEICLAGGPGPRSSRYLDWKARKCEEIMNRCRRMAPDLLDGAELIEAATPTSYRDWTGTIGGSAYGVKHQVQGVPLTVRTPLDRLTLAGQGLLLPGVMGAAASGVVAAGRVLGARTAWEVLRQV
jgi:all-trans-retinol 13,14-reductase